MTDESRALVPIEERTIDFYGDQVIAALVEVQDQPQVYVPLRPICEYLGLTWASQTLRVRRDEVLSEAVRSVIIMKTELGERQMLCLPLDYLPGWLFGLTTSKVRPELRDKVLRYKRECYRVLARAFQIDTLASHPLVQAPNATLLQVREMGLAIVALAEQQMALEQRHAEAEARLEGRLDRAAEVVRSLSHRLDRAERKIEGGQVIGEEQAAEISARVKALAERLTEMGEPGNHYQRVFAELYRRFGVASYRAIRINDYPAVLQFLEDWRQATLPMPAADTARPV